MKSATPLMIILAALIAACDTGVTAASLSSLSALSLQISTADRDATGNILVVGDRARAEVTGQTIDCGFSQGPCPAIGAYVGMTQNGGVVRIPNKSLRTPGSAILVGTSPGTAIIAATTDGLASSDSLRVVAAPLPVDSLWVRPNGSDFDSVSEIQRDTEGNIQSLTLPVNGSVLLTLIAFRYNEAMTLPMAFSQTNASIAWASFGCRAPVVDPTCAVAGSSWITGLAPSITTVTVIARNQLRSFLVTVE
jgi:hypothetical protein